MVRPLSVRASVLGLGLAALLLPTACTEQVHAPLPFDPSVLDDAPWEMEWDPAEFTTWREGRVIEIDGDGTPTGSVVAGAKVALMVARPDGRGELHTVAEVEADADGRFRVGPGPTSAWGLRASSPGFAPMLGGSGIARPGAAPLAEYGPVHLVLRRSRVLRGRVMEDRSPVADAFVVAEGMAYWQRVRTDAEGRFELHAPPAPATVTLDGLDREAGVVSVPYPSGEAELTVQARPIPPVHGWVVDALDGRPVAGAVVAVPPEYTRRTVTDREGRFKIVAPRQGRLVGMATEYGWRSTPMPRAGDVEIRLHPSRPVAGRVVDARGEPVPGARLRAAAVRDDGGWEGILGPRTGADGTFRFGWLPPPMRGRPELPLVVATRRGSGTSEAHVAKGAAGSQALELVLPGVDALAGSVTRHGGEEVADAPLVVEWSLGVEDGHARAALGVRTWVIATTGEDGRFHAPGVPRHADVSITLLHQGHRDRRPVPVESGARTGPIAFVLPEGVPLQGQVVDVLGIPIPGPAHVRVKLISSSTAAYERTVTLDADGRFRLPDVPAGTYQINAGGGPFDRGGVVARSGDDDIRIVVERLASLEFQARFPEGAARPDGPVGVSMFPADDPAARPRTALVGKGPDGVGVVRQLTPGKYRVEAECGHWRGDVDELQVVDGDRSVVTLEMVATLHVAGRLVDGGGAPVAGELVRLRPLGIVGARVRTARSGPDGSVLVSGLDEGRWELRVTPTGAAPLVRMLEIGAESLTGLDLRLPSSGSLRVRVFLDGEPAPGAVVDLADEDGSPLFAFADGEPRLVSRMSTGDDGTVLVVGVRAGTVRLKVRADGRTLPPATAEVVAGETAEVTVR